MAAVHLCTQHIVAANPTASLAIALVAMEPQCWKSHWVVWVAPTVGSLLAVLFYGTPVNLCCPTFPFPPGSLPLQHAGALQRQGGCPGMWVNRSRRLTLRGLCMHTRPSRYRRHPQQAREQGGALGTVGPLKAGATEGLI